MFLLDHALPPVAMGPLMTRVRKGLDNYQEDSTPHTQRFPLPAPVALAILVLAKRLLPTVHYDGMDPELLLLRAVSDSTASYMFFNWGECSACALMEDIAINDTHITLLL
jgi:hypothetical protein